MKTVELPLDGASKAKTRLCKIRNPWGVSNWKGKYSEGSAEYKKLMAYFKANGIKGEEAIKDAGRFWMHFDDAWKYLDQVDVAWSQESRSG